MLSLMEKGSVIVDTSNDEPGAIETSRATTHEDPRYIVDGIVHYCVANIPGAVAHSASVAYAAQMLPLTCTCSMTARRRPASATAITGGH